MKNTPVNIAVCNQKGGIGKSTFTVLLASYLHYVVGYDTLVVNCDYPQWSGGRDSTAAGVWRGGAGNGGGCRCIRCCLRWLQVPARNVRNGSRAARRSLRRWSDRSDD